MTIWLPSHVRPSYKTGYARSRSESASPNLWDGLVGSWCPFLGMTGETVRDLSGAGNDGALVNITVDDWHQSQYGPYLQLDGASDYIDTGFVGVSGTAASTVVVWMNTVNTDTLDNSLFAYGTNSTAAQYVLTIENGVIWNRFGANTVSGGSGLNDGDWHQIVCVKPRGAKSAACRLYADGNEITSGNTGTVTLNIGTDSTVMIGDFTELPGYDFNGEIGTASQWDRELSDQEIRTLYRDPLAPFRRRIQIPLATQVEAGGGWQAYWAPRLAGFIGSGVK